MSKKCQINLMVNVIPLVSGILFTSMLHAENYQLVFINKNQATLVDADNLSKKSQRIQKAPVLTIRSKGNYQNVGSLSNVAVIQGYDVIDCKTAKVRLGGADKENHYRMYDENLNQIQYVDDKKLHAVLWMPLGADTSGYGVAEIACTVPAARKLNSSFTGKPINEIVKYFYSQEWPVK